MKRRTISNEEGMSIWKRSIVVGVTLVSLVVGALIDGSPSDSNVWAVFYGIFGFLFLWPYQVVLTFKLWRCDGDVSKYLGTALSLISIGLLYVSDL